MTGPASSDAVVAAAEGRVALGEALIRRAPQVAATVVAGWAAEYTSTSMSFEALRQVLTRNAGFGTELIGRYLSTGQGATAEETREMAERSTAVVVDIVVMTRVVKNYLRWRDHTILALREEAATLGSERALVNEAVFVIRLSCDVSIINMVKLFDVQRAELRRRLHEERAKLTHMALHDPLTGLANRMLLLDRLAHAIAGTARRTEQVGVLYLDLNGFKGINDSYGHQAGDDLLRAVAERLSSLVRPSDTVARLGGDEFVVVCADLQAGQDALDAFARRIEDGVAVSLPGQPDVVVSASVGAALAERGTPPEQVLAAADAAMYTAKQQRAARGRELSAP